MTAERKKWVETRLKRDTDEYLINRFGWYVQNFNPLDEERCEDYELVKAELLRRMEAKK